MIPVLRGMDMQIVHRRYQQPVAKISNILPCVFRRQRRIGAYDIPIVTHGNIAVLQHLKAVRRRRKEDISPV